MFSTDIITSFCITSRRNDDIWATQPADLAVIGARGDNDVSAGALNDIYGALCIEYGGIERTHEVYISRFELSIAGRTFLRFFSRTLDRVTNKSDCGRRECYSMCIRRAYGMRMAWRMPRTHPSNRESCGPIFTANDTTANDTHALVQCVARRFA